MKKEDFYNKNVVFLENCETHVEFFPCFKLDDITDILCLDVYLIGHKNLRPTYRSVQNQFFESGDVQSIFLLDDILRHMEILICDPIDRFGIVEGNEYHFHL